MQAEGIYHDDQSWNSGKLPTETQLLRINSIFMDTRNVNVYTIILNVTAELSFVMISISGDTKGSMRIAILFKNRQRYFYLSLN